ncbi:MAG: hypothetical protein AAF317_20505 [Pseudomonadota bacterium]
MKRITTQLPDPQTGAPVILQQGVDLKDVLAAFHAQLKGIGQRLTGAIEMDKGRCSLSAHNGLFPVRLDVILEFGITEVPDGETAYSLTSAALDEMRADGELD